MASRQRPTPIDAQSWGQLARRLARVAEDLETLASNLPAGTPDPVDAKALRRALGLIGQHSGTLKRSLGIGG